MGFTLPPFMQKAMYQSMIFKTPKEIKLYDIRVYMLHMSLVAGIAIMVIVNDIIKEHGYQQVDQIIGSVQPRMVGVAKAANGDVWDVWDAVYPPKEKGAIFVTTNYNVARQQKRGTCSGSDKHSEALPLKGACEVDHPTRYGFTTGREGNVVDGTAMCEIEGWCPAPATSKAGDTNILNDVGEWDLMLRVDIKAPKFNVSYSTAPSGHIHGIKEGYNMFKLKNVLKAAGTSFDEVKKTGALILAQITFTCDADLGLHHCDPKFVFTRVDESEEPDQNGFMFRVARYFWSDMSTPTPKKGNQTDAERRRLADKPKGETTRDLWQLYGIRFLFNVGGSAGRYDFNTCAQKFGASMALAALAVIVTDKFCEKVLPLLFKKYHWYNDLKYQTIDSMGRDKGHISFGY